MHILYRLILLVPLTLSIITSSAMGEKKNRDGYQNSTSQDWNIETALSYDTTQSLDIRVDSVGQQSTIKYSDVSYNSPIGGRVTAVLVAPVGEDLFAGSSERSDRF